MQIVQSRSDDLFSTVGPLNMDGFFHFGYILLSHVLSCIFAVLILFGISKCLSGYLVIYLAGMSFASSKSLIYRLCGLC